MLVGRIVKLSELGKQGPTTRSRIKTYVTPMERARGFKAAFKGTCVLCMQPINVGDKIFYRSGPKPMHVKCPPKLKRQRVIKGRRTA